MQGVVVKGSLHLETLGKVGVFTFDKSGTLTEGKFKVVAAQVVRPQVAAALAGPGPDTTSGTKGSAGAGGDDKFVEAGGADPSDVAALEDGEDEGAAGWPQGGDVGAAPGMDLQRMLSYVGALEVQSSHPVAPAIVGYAASQGALKR